MATYDYDIGILGGGAAGLTIAAGAARAGAKGLPKVLKRRFAGEEDGGCLCVLTGY